MKVIIREELQCCGNTIEVYKYDPTKTNYEQLKELIDKEAEWFKDVHIDIEGNTFDEYDTEDDLLDEAHIFARAFSIYYYIREVKKM